MNLPPLDPRDIATAMGDAEATGFLDGPARHLSADSDDQPDGFWLWDVPGIIAVIVIAAAFVVAISRLPA